MEPPSKQPKLPPVNPAGTPSVTSPRAIFLRASFALLGGLILRLWMLRAFPQLGGDSLIYGNLATGLLQQGRFAITDGSGVLHATLIRLPGYPLFLALCFRLFGVANYNAVAYLQIALELASCLLLADFTRRIATPRSGLNALWLATMCPFTAVYSGAPLTESLTFDAICLALWSLERYVSRSKLESKHESRLESKHESGCPTFNAASPRLRWAQSNQSTHPTPARPLSFQPAQLSQNLTLPLFTLAITSAAMLRPDGALLAIALWPALLISKNRTRNLTASLRNALLCGLISMLPFAAWAVRNWEVFHVFQPLAPRYANDPGESPHPGWQHWVKTWCLDFTCTSDIYWNVPDGAIALTDLPQRAFDSPQQQQQTAALFTAYSTNQEITPEIDAGFAELARQRTAAHPLRTWLWLPLGRLADMTLRPRVENLTIDLHWWEYSQHRPETRFSIAYGILNLLLLILAFVGFLWRPRLWPYLAAYLVLRSLLLLTVEAPETRYTLEFFPIVFAIAGIALQKIFASRHAVPPVAHPAP